MNWLYAYTPVIWPSIGTIFVLLFLAAYGWRRRSVPGALPFMIYCLVSVPILAFKIMAYLAVDFETKVFWFKIENIWWLPAATAMFCFMLEYAYPGRWLTRRNLALLSIAPLLALVSLATNDIHHLSFLGYRLNGSISPVYGPLGWVLVLYILVLTGLGILVFGWLFIKSPQHRWPVVLVLAAQILTRGLTIMGPLIRDSWLFYVPELAFTVAACAIALFAFHIFDPIPLARQTVLDQLRDGMIVLDTQGQVTSLNPTGQAILRLPERVVRGRAIQEILPAYQVPQNGGIGETEISLGSGLDGAQETRNYLVQSSLLKDWRGVAVGHLLLLYDITAQKQAQAQILEQQRALAALQEREHLARELHDGIGQVLGYVKIQAQAARDRLAQDQKEAADTQLAQLVTVAQDAHTDVRDYLLGAKTTAVGQFGLLTLLRQYLRRFSEQYGLQTELVEPSAWTDDILEPTVGSQILRIVQEALTNARKHAQASCVTVHLQLEGQRAQVIVQDDGIGFDPALVPEGVGQNYGLGFMRERAEEVGGSISIQAAPGHGTRVVVDVPRRKHASLAGG